MLLPGELPLDFPSVSAMRKVSLREASQRLAFPFDDRTDQSDAQTFESSSQRIAVGSFAVDQSCSSWRAQRSGRDQLIDQSHLLRRGAVEDRMQRDTFPIDQQLNFGSIARLGRTNASHPFFPRTIVVSARRVSRSRWRRSSLGSTIRCQARCNTPVSVHNLNRCGRRTWKGANLVNLSSNRRSRVQTESHPGSHD